MGKGSGAWKHGDAGLRGYKVQGGVDGRLDETDERISELEETGVGTTLRAPQSGQKR